MGAGFEGVGRGNHLADPFGFEVGVDEIGLVGGRRGDGFDDVGEAFVGCEFGDELLGEW